MDLRFRDDLNADAVEAAVDRLERAIREAHPPIRYIFVEAGSISRTRSTDSGAASAGGPPS
jgi:hypothetical protein